MKKAVDFARRFLGIAASNFHLRRSSPLSSGLTRRVCHSRYRLLLLSHGAHEVRLSGFRIAFRGAEQLRFLFQEIFVHACYFFEAETLRPRIIDCGSNIGLSVLFFKALYPNSRITAFEPDPSTFAVLEKNVTKNRLSDVTLRQSAVMGKEGTVILYRGNSPSVSSLLMSTNEKRLGGEKVSVPSERLSQSVDAPIDLLKLDVEGAELEVIDELKTSNKLELIKAMHLEYHHNIPGDDKKLSSLLSVIESAGFRYQLTSDRPCHRKGCQDVAIFCYR